MAVFTGKMEVWEDTGAGRRYRHEIDVEIVNGEVVVAGGGSAVHVLNKSGGDLARDQLVYVTGVTDGVLEIDQADANVDDKPAMFFLPAALLDNGNGLAYGRGLSVATLNTSGAGAVDDPVYLSESAGGWTLTAPSAAGSIDQIVGRVAVKDGSVGQIMWSVEAGDYDIGTNELQEKAVTLAILADLAQGSIYTGQASNRPAALDLKGDGEIAIGDATDVNAHPFTGSVSLTNAGLTALTKGAETEGRACVGSYYQTGVAADTELVTIDGRTYEFDTNSSITGDIQVDINADQTADASCIALAAAINADASRTVDAIVMAGNDDTTAGVLLIAKVVGADNFTLTTDVTNGGTVSGATLTDAAAAASPDILAGEYTVTAADVTLWARTGGNSVAIAGFVSSTPPVIAGLVVRTSADAIKSLATVVVTLVQPNANYWVLTFDDPNAVLASGDAIGFHLTLLG